MYAALAGQTLWVVTPCENSSAGKFSSKFGTNRSFLKIPLHRKRVATLPCETLLPGFNIRTNRKQLWAINGRVSGYWARTAEYTVSMSISTTIFLHWSRSLATCLASLPLIYIVFTVTVTELHSSTKMFSEESCSVVGLSENVSFQLRSELPATGVRWAGVWWKCVPDGRSRDGESSLADKLFFNIILSCLFWPDPLFLLPSSDFNSTAILAGLVYGKRSLCPINSLLVEQILSSGAELWSPWQLLKTVAKWVSE